MNYLKFYVHFESWNAKLSLISNETTLCGSLVKYDICLRAIYLEILSRKRVPILTNEE